MPLSLSLVHLPVFPRKGQVLWGLLGVYPSAPCTGLGGVSQKFTSTHLETQVMTLFGNRVFTDKITVRIDMGSDRIKMRVSL